MQDATNSSSTDGYAAQVRQVPVSVFRRRSAAIHFSAGLMGVLAALSVLAVMGSLLTSGIAGVDIFEPGMLERFEAPTVAAIVVVVFAAFFCGGWVHGVLSRKEIRPRRQLKRRTRELLRSLSPGGFDVASGQFDEFAGRVK